MSRQDFAGRLRRATTAIGVKNVDLWRALQAAWPKTNESTVSQWLTGAKGPPLPPQKRRDIETILCLTPHYLDAMAEMTDADLARARAEYRASQTALRHAETTIEGAQGPQATVEAILRGLRAADLGALATLVERRPDWPMADHMLTLYKGELADLLRGADARLRVTLAEAVAAVTTVALGTVAALDPGRARGDTGDDATASDTALLEPPPPAPPPATRRGSGSARRRAAER